MAAEREADQVVLLVIGQRAADPVFTHLFRFQLVRVARRRADRPRPAAHADGRVDVRLRHVGVEHTGRAHRIGCVRAFRRRAVRRDDGNAEEEQCNPDERSAYRHALQCADAICSAQGVQSSHGPAESVATLGNMLTTDQKGVIAELAIAREAAESASVSGVLTRSSATTSSLTCDRNYFAFSASGRVDTTT
jgi:hypothetical protein